MSQPQVCTKLPVLDLSKPLEPHVLPLLSQALREWGFFYISNCGISDEIYRKICVYSKQIFELPLTCKLKIGPSSTLRTYTPPFIASPFFECLKVSGPDFMTSAKCSADELFIQDNSEFSELLQEYGNKMVELAKKVIQIILKSLGDDSDRMFNETYFTGCQGYFRLVSYTPPAEENEAEGLGTHTDMSCITILFQDGIGGLQMRSKEGRWMDIIPTENYMVVNIGDLLQAWSNDQLRSCEHRVILKQNIGRFSLPFFWSFPDDMIISSPDEVVGNGKPRLYKPFVCRDYTNFRESNREGNFEKVGFNVRDFAAEAMNQPSPVSRIFTSS